MPASHGAPPRVLRSADGTCGRVEDQGGPTERRRASTEPRARTVPWDLM